MPCVAILNRLRLDLPPTREGFGATNFPQGGHTRSLSMIYAFQDRYTFGLYELHGV